MGPAPFPIPLSAPSAWLTLGLASLAAFSLRTVVMAVGPLVPALRADLGVSFSAAGLLLSTPPALLALLGMPAGRSADRWGAPRLLALGMVLLAAGALARAGSGTFSSLWLATVAMGIGVAVAQCALPRLVNDLYPDRMATATGIYSFGLHTGATIGAYTSGSVLLVWLGSWRGTFWLWGGIAGLTALLWMVLLPRLAQLAGVPAQPAGRMNSDSAAAPSPWRSGLAWAVAMVFGIQAVVYFAGTSWLPSYYFDLGLPLGAAGVAAAGLVFGQVPAVLICSYLSDRYRLRRPFLAGAAALTTTAYTCILFWPLSAPYLWPLVGGFGHGTIFALSLAIPGDIAPRARVGATAGFVVTVGYTLAAAGPYVLGALRDWTGSLAGGIAANAVLSLCILLLALAMPETARRRPGTNTE